VDAPEQLRNPRYWYEGNCCGRCPAPAHTPPQIASALDLTPLGIKTDHPRTVGLHGDLP